MKIIIAAALVLGSVMLHAQTAQKPTFEVATIRLNTTRPSGPVDRTLGCQGTDSRSKTVVIPMSRCIARYEPLKLVIAMAYDVPPSSLYAYEGKMVSGPDWIEREIYHIEAKAEAATTQAQLKLMLQELLADRFKLKLHRENREMPVYALVVGKNGHKLKAAPADRDCEGQSRRDHRYELGAMDISGQCHGFVPEDGALRGQSVDMSDFAEMLSIWAGRIVVDKTGLDGLFDIKMPRMISAEALNVMASKEIAAGARGGVPAGPLEPRILPDNVMTVFTALEQIGLRLEATKGPVEVLVIDNIERPTEN
jgi:uncharacterized protein (TIGR03435 family)